MPCASTSASPCGSSTSCCGCEAKASTSTATCSTRSGWNPKGGYRTFRTGDWPAGPDRWLERCRRTGLAPGFWFGTNALVGIEPIPEWQDSLTAKKGSLSLFEGGFLAHFMATLEMWHARGVRSFKFDFTDLDAATAEAQRTLSPAEITSRNTSAFRAALVAFRDRHPDALLLGYNGLGGDFDNTSYPFKKTVDTEWLDAFDSLYCGDPRPSDTPAMRFWRSLDIYSDQMARRSSRTACRSAASTTARS